MSEQILFTLLRTSIAVTAASVIVVFLLGLCRCRSFRIHRIAWAFVLLQGVLWIRVPLNLSVLSPEEQAVDMEPVSLETPEFPGSIPLAYETDIASDNPFFAPVENSEPLLHSVPPRSYLDPAIILFGIYLLGFLAVILLRFIGLYRLMMKIKSAREINETIFHGKRYRIFLTGNLGPAIFRNMIMVPESLWEESSELIRQGILKHEFSHARHRDGLKSFFLSLVTMIHWFNPIAWFALRKFNEATEWRCDSEAFGEEKNGLAIFAESMLALKRSEPKYLAWVQSYKNHDIKERIRRLKEHHLNAKESTMKKIGILSLVFFLFCFGLLKVQLVAQTPKPEEKPAPVESIKDDKIEKVDSSSKDNTFVTEGGHTHLVVFAPKGDFAPRAVSELLNAVSFEKMNEYSVKLGYFRTKPVDGKLIGSFATPNPENFEKMIDSIPNLEFLSSERLTKEKFEEYEKTPQLSLPDPVLVKRLSEIENSQWYKKLNDQQKNYVRIDEEMFSYVYDPKNYEIGNARDEFEKRWIKRLEAPEPGHPGHTNLSTYDEAIIGLATIKSDKAAPLLVKIAAEKVLKDNAHRHYATKALGILGDPSVIPDLIPLIYHYNWNTRFDAQVALVRLTGQNFGTDDIAWGRWYNENRAKLGKNLPEFDPTPIDWTCGSDNPELKKWADREEQKLIDSQ